MKGADKNAMIVGKRALTKDEVKLADSDNDNGPAATTTTEEEERRVRAERCRYYWGVEQHCFRKMAMTSSSSAATTTPALCIPRYDGTYTDQDGQPWMLFGAIPDAECLNDLMLRDQADHRLYREHHLYLTSRALGLPVDDTASLTATLDVLVSNLLEAVAFVHSHRIVHRDIKPSNCLVSATLKRLVLIDFGSAADLDTVGVLKENIGLSDGGGRVAVSPIYAAPELFVSANRPEEALKFDCFSVGLLICQLLFQYLEERTESGFRQQLERAQWDLDVWLQRTLQSKVRPIGIGDALQVLQDRPGFWRLLQDLLREDPYDRITARAALERWRRITTNRQPGGPEFFDGKYLQDVFASIENCEIPSVRSLRFVATFQRNRPLGLYLAEAASDDVDLEPLEMAQWKHATADAIDKEVFVQGTVPEGQAEQMGIFEVGDRLNGIGELPFKGEGFERALAMVRSIYFHKTCLDVY
jgi:serine/threonine protein kinase